MIKKTGTPFFVELNSHQKYFGASGFITKVVNLTDGTISIASNDAVEIVDVIDTPATSTVDAAAAEGAKQITVQSGGGITDGMVFEDANGNKYYVEEVTGDVLKLKFPLTQGIAFGDTLTEVGNSGIYKIELTINAPGNYGVYIANSSINLRSKGIQYTVKDIVVDDIATKIDILADSLNTALGEIESKVDDSKTHDFTVFAG